MPSLQQLLGLLGEYASSLFWDNLFLHNHSRLASRMRQWRLGTDCFIDTGVVISAPAHFTAQPNCAIYHGTYVLNIHGQLSLGECSHVGGGCFVNALYGHVSVGSHVAIGPHTCVFSHSNSYTDGKYVTDSKKTQDVIIGNNVFIGAACSILPGVVIGDNVVVGAGLS